MNQYANVDRDLAQINSILKSQKAKVTIGRQGGTLLLKATLPLKPGESHIRQKKQYQLFFNIPADLGGLHKAHKEALELAAKIASLTFTWEEPKYLGKKGCKPLPKYIKDWVEVVKDEYMKNKSSTPTTLRTWQNTYAITYSRLPQNQPLSRAVLDALLRSTDANSSTRVRDCLAVSRLCAIANFPFDAKSYRGKYRPKERYLPSDAEIEASYQQLLLLPDRTQNKNTPAQKAWYFGILATYGLRTAEVFLIDWQASFMDHRHTIRISHNTKTGLPRLVYPLHPHWVIAFDLLNVKLPTLECARNSLANKISDWFHRADLNFNPYDLRHRYAIRGHELGVRPATLSKWMGHSLIVHSSIYQQYMDLSSHNKEFDALFSR